MKQVLVLGAAETIHEPLKYFMQPLLFAFVLFLCYT